MRGHITRTFKITEATIAYFDTQSGQVVTLPEKITGKKLGDTKKILKEATAKWPEHDGKLICLGTATVEETRAMSEEDFIKNSFVVPDGRAEIKEAFGVTE